MKTENMAVNKKPDFSGFRRFLHWGPIIAISIIKSITVVTVYMNSQWWPPNNSLAGFLNQAIFIVLSALTAFNFVMAALVGPKFLPLNWKPKNKKHEKFLQYCEVCEGFKSPRSHHCRKCGRCVIKMDHHCPWINHCVGFANHAFFTSFLTFAVLGCSHAAFILICSLYRGLYRDYYIYYRQFNNATVNLGMWSLILTVFNIGLAIGVVIAVGMLLFFQLRTIIRNRTGIEEWILDKAKYRREAKARALQQQQIDEVVEPFIYPYDLGCMENMKQVLNLNCQPVGDGFTWKIVDECDQFTLTREQQAQKAEKRARTRTYRIAKRSTGSWFPLWSQGFFVCVSPPLTDEPRIKLDVEDIVKVTRWRKHWLFGEKVLDIDENALQDNSKNGISKPVKEVDIVKKKRVRGWFPRKCAVELYEEYDDDEEEDNIEPVLLPNELNESISHEKAE